MRIRMGAAVALSLALGLAVTVWAGAHHAPGPGVSRHQQTGGPMRVTMDELHRQGGVPRGWRFTFQIGTPKTGRDVFVKLECFTCHEIKGERFSQVGKQPGPELSEMGSHHPAEYVAESILNPNAVIVTGPGHAGADGLSIMPDYRDSLTVAELADLVAYLRSLRAGAPRGHPESPEPERVLGPYRIRLAYQAGFAQGHAHGAQSVGTAKSGTHDHLMAFVSDVETGEPIPYLPVSATVQAPKQPARTVRLVPMVGDPGFHYGADLPLSSGATRVILSIGPTTTRVMPVAADRYSKALKVSFEWQGRERTGRSAPSEGGHGHAGTPKHH
ncbi:MAG: iron transporter [Actinomycetota bacterium]